MVPDLPDDPATLARRAHDWATLSLCLALYHVVLLLLVALVGWRTFADPAFAASAVGHVFAGCCKLGVFFSVITLPIALLSGHASLRLGDTPTAGVAAAGLVITYLIVALCLLGCAAYGALGLLLLGG